MSSRELLSLKNLCAWYAPDKPVLSDFSLDLGTNEVVGLIGLNGAGKTTFIKAVAGLLNSFRLDDAVWDGHSFSFRDKDFKKNGNVKWNFTKFLISRDGDIIARFEPTAPMKTVAEKVKAVL